MSSDSLAASQSILDDLLGSAAIRSTPYLAAHLAVGATFYAKGGWLRPLHYGDPAAEQRACRENAAIFDVHSMGKVAITGAGADAFIDRVITNRVPTTTGDAVYTAICAADGRLVDDVVLYRCVDEWFLISNTVSRQPLVEHLRSVAVGADVQVRDVTAERAYLALQGPASWEILRAWLPEVDRDAVLALDYYACVELTGRGGGTPDWTLVCRTGYTGELGYELILPIDQALATWQSLLRMGASWNLAPAGGSALQTLRMEKGYRGFGADIDRTMTPAEAGIGWVVRVDGRSVLGQKVLEAQMTAPKTHCRVWPVGSPDASEVKVDDEIHAPGLGPIGHVTSVSFGETVGQWVGLARFERPGQPPEDLRVVSGAGETSRLQVHSVAPYDPERTRLRPNLT